MKYALHWFRRDLRIASNLALQEQYIRHQGKVLGIFCFDHSFLSRPDFSPNRFQFFLESLQSLKRDLNSLGGDLLVLDVGPIKAFNMLFEKFSNYNISLPQSISWNRDYEPFSRTRDEQVSDYFFSKGIEIIEKSDHVIVQPEDLLKSDLRPYSIYTPYARRWNELIIQDKYQETFKATKKSFSFLEKLDQMATNDKKGKKIFHLKWKQLFKDKIQIKDHLDDYTQKNKKNVTIQIPKAGELEAYRALKMFKSKLENYSRERDFPFKKMTSRLSIFLKNGSLTTKQIIAFYNLKPYVTKLNSRDVFLSELIWREFYYYILYHYPNVESESFNPKYRKIKWENSNELFEKWTNGMTGFPIVDAGMRELKNTGFMHNRVRMIVSSFLIKDLLIDWKKGEQYFMSALLDGDLAPNNGGWQWSASTGCDAVPYFRIFNPWRQSKRFDPNGEYIKTFVPELKLLEGKLLHKPVLNHPTYPAPIVNHDEQRKKVLKLYKDLN